MFKIVAHLEHSAEGILQAEHHLLSNPSFAKEKLKIKSYTPYQKIK